MALVCSPFLFILVCPGVAGAAVIFNLYANEGGTHIYKNDMIKLVLACDGGYIPEAVADCFIEVSPHSFLRARLLPSKIINLVRFLKRGGKEMRESPKVSSCSCGPFRAKLFMARVS